LSTTTLPGPRVSRFWKKKDKGKRQRSRHNRYYIIAEKEEVRKQGSETQGDQARQSKVKL